MTTPADDPAPETQAALTEVQRIVNDARQAGARRYVCVSCNRLYSRAEVVTTEPALCRGCKALWERRR